MALGQAMRATLSVASSLTSALPWWRNVSVASEHVTGVLGLAILRVIAARPRSGVAVTIRVHGEAAPDCRHLAGSRPAEVVKFAGNSGGNSGGTHSDNPS